jgi:hypothetical protein
MVDSNLVFVIGRAGVRYSDCHILNSAVWVYEYGVRQEVWTFPVLFCTLDDNGFVSFSQGELQKTLLKKMLKVCLPRQILDKKYTLVRDLSKVT